MKKFTSLLFTFIVLLTYAQERYSYVVVPKEFDGFNGKDNPYGLSSSTTYLLKKKGIKVFYKGEKKELLAPCDGLNAVLKNSSTMFKNKIKFVLENCNGIEVYSAEGKGKSKEFKQGYTEALQKAISSLGNLPYKDDGIELTQSLTSSPIQQKPIQEIIETKNEYEPQNMYFNNTYVIDIIESSNNKQLKIINGTLLGYTDLQSIATLSPSGIDDQTYLIKWITPSKKTITGIAKFIGKELQISLSDEKGSKLIKLKKP